jgi:hypothetical protein
VGNSQASRLLEAAPGWTGKAPDGGGKVPGGGVGSGGTGKASAGGSAPGVGVLTPGVGVSTPGVGVSTPGVGVSTPGGGVAAGGAEMGGLRDAGADRTVSVVSGIARLTRQTLAFSGSRSAAGGQRCRVRPARDADRSRCECGRRASTSGRPRAGRSLCPTGRRP